MYCIYKDYMFKKITILVEFEILIIITNHNLV